MKILNLVLFLMLSSLMSCDDKYSYAISYKMDMNADFQYTSKQLILQNGKCLEVTTQKKFGDFSEKVTKIELKSKHCMPITIGNLIKEKYGICSPKKSLISEGEASGERTELILSEDCVCYQEYQAGQNNLDSEIISKKTFATFEQCKEFIPADKQKEIIQEFIKYKMNVL